MPSSVSHPPCEDVVVDLGPHGLSGMVCSKGQSVVVAPLLASGVTFVSGHR